MKEYLTLSEASELIGKSKETLRRWDREGKLNAVREPMSNYRVYRKSDVQTLFSDFLSEGAKEVISNYVNQKMNIQCWNYLRGLVDWQLEWRRQV